MAFPGDPTPLERFAQCVDHFALGAKPRDRFRVGVEYEKLALDGQTLRPLPYEAQGGRAGIRTLLDHLVAHFGWQPLTWEGPNLIALERGRASITLEPGGQFEMSGAPHRDLHDVQAELETHVAELSALTADYGVRFAWLGLNPVTPLREVPWMPKGRYVVMRDYLPRHGSLGLAMMKQTCTVQANLDYASEQDAMAMLRTAAAATPAVTALFANSPFHEGHETRHQSYRAHIWTDTDPDRCGIPPFFFEKTASFEDYARWALDVPMFFLYRDGYRSLADRRVTFGQFLSSGLDGEHATLGDWELHVSTLFPEVRLKRYIELRGADCVPPRFIPALAALWKGLLCDGEARQEAFEIMPDVDHAARLVLQDDAARLGLCADSQGRSLEDLCRALIAVSREGLRRCARVEGLGEDETRYLDPLELLLSPGRALANEVRDAMSGRGGLAALCEA